MMLIQTLPPFDEDTVQIVWWTGLMLALIVTLIDVALVIRVIRVARKIAALADRTLTAAGGIATNTAAISNTAATNQVATALIEKAQPIVQVASAIENKLAAVSAFVGGRRS